VVAPATPSDRLWNEDLGMRRNSSAVLSPLAALCCSLALLCLPAVAAAQETGTVTGTVTRAGEGSALSSVSVSVEATGQSTVTGADGKYTLRRVPAGPQRIVFRWLGYRPTQVDVTVEAGGTVTADAGLEPVTVALSEIVVEGASRAPERIVEAPAAISVVPPEVLQSVSITGQAPAALQTVPGADVVQSGVNDFNVNARGFNSSLNRRVLVLQDGRDLAIAFLGAQEWNGMTQPLEDLGKVEMVRGPGSALYGANAFSGVVNITTLTAREALGTKVTVSGGELETFRGDLRHASLFAGDRFGLRVNAGYNRSDTYSRTRTRLDGTSLAREYEDATDEPVGPVREVVPLRGQTTDAAGDAVGDRDPLVNGYGSARLDYYADNGSVFTVDGGASQVQNEIFVTGIGRVQVAKAIKPYIRAAVAHDRYNVFGYWYSRTSLDPQVSLQSGRDIEERSDIFHGEGQTNWNFLEDRGRVVAGASVRNTHVNTSGTLMNLANDDRSDNLYSVYGQVEYKLVPQLRVVGALRWDDGDLIDRQFSPKGALVFSPNEDHSFRFSVNRAFQTPNYSEFFLQVPVAQPTASPATLEGGIEQYYAAVRASLPPQALAGLTITDNLPWNFSAQTQALALGNADLKVEKVTGWELGYKGSLSNKAYVTVDGYINELKDFVTDLLPGVNSAFPSFALDATANVSAELTALDQRIQFLQSQGALTAQQAAQLRAPIPLLLGGYAQLRAGTTLQGANALATLPDGSRAIVLSYTNAGRVTERGVEVGLGYQFTPEIRGDVSFTGFDFTVKSQQLGDQLVPNTPSKKGTFSVTYTGQQGLDGNLTVRLVDGYQWSAGVFQGYVPSSEFVNLSAGYRVNNYVRVHATATNLFDQKRFQLYGGSVIGRRVLGGVTATF
jgi:outer membrane receptor protein involved in Fe transport